MKQSVEFGLHFFIGHLENVLHGQRSTGFVAIDFTGYIYSIQAGCMRTTGGHASAID